MSIWSDIKKAAKGSKEYQEGKAKRKAKRAKSPLGKAVKSVSKDIKKGLKGSKEYQEGKAKRKAAKAEKKAGKSWTKAVKKQKKKGEAGVTLSSLVAKRKGLKKGTAEYAAVQNKINKAYGSKKVHKATTKSRKPAPKKDVKSLPKKAATKKAATKKSAPKKVAPKTGFFPRKVAPPGAVGPGDDPQYAPKKGQKSTLMRNKPKFAQGGKVESNPFGWPSRDARNGGKK